MTDTMRVGIYMLGFFLALVAAVFTVLSFTGQSAKNKYIKCENEKQQGAALVAYLDHGHQEIVISGRKIAGTDVKIFSETEILAEWYHAGGRTEFLLDRVSGNLTITDTAKNNRETKRVLNCQVTRPKL